MKKVLYLLLMIICLSSRYVTAENYYENKNGVVMTTAELNYISDLYYESYPEYITEDEYNFLVNNNFFDKKVYSNIIDVNKNNGISLASSSVTTNAKSIKMSKSCSDKCLVTLVAKWLYKPNIKSWDVIGMRLSNCAISSYFQAQIIGDDDYAIAYTNPKMFSNGLGYSLKLANHNNLVASMSALITKDSYNKN